MRREAEETFFDDDLRLDMEPPGCCRSSFLKSMARLFFVVQFAVMIGSMLQLMRAYDWASRYDSQVWLGLNCSYSGMAILFMFVALFIRTAHTRGNGDELFPVIYSNLASLLYLVCQALLTLVPTSILVVYYIYYDGARPTLYNTDTDSHERFTLWICTHALNCAVASLGILQFLITVQFPFSFYLPHTILQIDCKTRTSSSTA